MIILMRRPNGSLDVLHKNTDTSVLTLIDNTTASAQAVYDQLRRDFPSMTIDAKGVLY